MNTNNIQKPITIAKNELVTGMVNLCNDSGLPFFVIEYILNDLLQEVRSAAQQQLDIDTKQYEQALKAQEEAQTKAQECE